MEFKDRIKALRTEKKLTQTDLASKFGKTESAARAWELGRTKPDADTLVSLAKYFRCTTDYLLGLSDFKDEIKIMLVNDLLEETTKLFLELNSSYGDLFLLTLNEMLKNSINLKEYSAHFYGANDASEFIQLDILAKMNKMCSCFNQLLGAEIKDVDKLYINFISCYENAEYDLREYRGLLMSVLINHAKNNRYIAEEIKKIDIEKYRNFIEEIEGNLSKDGDNNAT